MLDKNSKKTKKTRDKLGKTDDNSDSDIQNQDLLFNLSNS